MIVLTLQCIDRLYSLFNVPNIHGQCNQHTCQAIVVSSFLFKIVVLKPAASSRVDIGNIVFPVKVEKSLREATAQQNAHSVFVSLALKLLEERVHVACKEIITLEKQVSYTYFVV